MEPLDSRCNGVSIMEYAWVFFIRLPNRSGRVIASVERKRNPGVGEKITDFEVVILYKKKTLFGYLPLPPPPSMLKTKSDMLKDQNTR